MRSTKLFRALVLSLLGSALFACNRHSGQSSNSQSDTASPEVPKVVLEAKPPPDAVSLPGAADVAPPAPPAKAPVTAPPTPPAIDPVIADTEKKAAATDAQLATMTRREGEWGLGQAHSSYSAYSQGDELMAIEEKLSMGDAGSSSNKYYFNNGNLYLYEEDGNWSEINPPNPIVSRHIKRTMVFDAEGKLVTAAKQVDGVATPVQEYEATAVLAQAMNLRAGAMAIKAAAAEAKSPATAKAAPAEKSATAGKETSKKKEKPPESPARAEEKAAGDNHLHLVAGKGPISVKGEVAGKETREYLVQAKGGQLMTVNLHSPKQAATFAVYSSRGEIVSGLTDWSARLPRDGEYRIRVRAAQSGSTDFNMSVGLE